ncbi:uncharacterized protein LOC129927694 [Biomphalaria glabrata]|uniref:Uncharacterized protein LOC129927694 n=1 Tax=Biomphalaria glabrata TaxID=6526 RepID=A0A9W3B2W8_BIOGL|nr:uncharacterized protein LOC129927694 [Biomphalaria glabrata]
MSSPRRPKFWPKTTQPYPFYNMSEKRNLRTGSGTVRCVTKFQDGVSQDGRNKDVGHTNCCCRKCNVSESPSNVYWTLNVFTATHVVFDDIEASHTTLRLFYDRDDSPVISLDEVGVSEANIENDFCSLYCVTCDETVGNKLMEMYEHFYKVWLKFYRKYLESRSNHKLTFIVSHPHGCSKQVSVGQWEDMYKVGDRSQLTYTTCTCPGSSGAYVNCLGYKNSFWTWSECVHSKSLKSGLNSSGIGYL